MKLKKILHALLYMALGMSIATLFIIVAMLALPSIATSQNLIKLTDNFTTESTETTETEHTPTPEVIPQTSETIVVKKLSYAEQCELPYVATPKQRNVEEALETIKELVPYYPAMKIVYENADKYPDEVLKSLANNPEMLDYCVDYLTTDLNVIGEITEDEKPQDHPLFLQWDKRWGYMQYGSVSNVAASGCGPSCLSMVVYYLTGNPSATVADAATYSLKNNYYIEGIGTAWGLLDTYPRQYGLTVTNPSLSEQNLKTHLDNGNYLICSMRPGDFTSEGHFVLIYAYDENGFKINDPKCVYRSRLTWSYEQIEDDIKRIWSIGH